MNIRQWTLLVSGELLIAFGGGLCSFFIYDSLTPAFASFCTVLGGSLVVNTIISYNS